MVKKISVHDLTGSIPIDGDKTPITHQPVDKINAGEWGKMTAVELAKQREILQARYYKALSVGVSTGAMTEGLKMIDELIEKLDEQTEPLGYL